MFKSPFWSSDQTLSAKQNTSSGPAWSLLLFPTLLVLSRTQKTERPRRKKKEGKIEQYFLNLRKFPFYQSSIFILLSLCIPVASDKSEINTDQLLNNNYFSYSHIQRLSPSGNS